MDDKVLLIQKTVYLKKTLQSKKDVVRIKRQPKFKILVHILMFSVIGLRQPREH